MEGRVEENPYYWGKRVTLIAIRKANLCQEPNQEWMRRRGVPDSRKRIDKVDEQVPERPRGTCLSGGVRPELRCF